MLSTLLLPAMAQLPKDVLEQKNQNWNNIKNKRQGDARQPPILIDDSGMKPKEQSPTFSGDHRYRGEMGTPKPAINVFPSGK